MTDQKDQGQTEKVDGQSEKTLGLDEQFDKGWEEVELLTQQEQAAKAKPAEEAKAETKKEAGADTAKPFKVLKVGGKDVPVQTEDELVALAQKGYDYTRKTQQLADDRRSAEGEIKTKAEGLESKAEQMNKLLDRMVELNLIPAKLAETKKAAAVEAGEEAEAAGETSEEDVEALKRFGIDPANAYPYEKNMARSLAALERFVQESKLKDAQAVVDKAIAEERDNFPFDDVTNDKGENLTQNQITSIVVRKREQSGIAKPPIDQIATWAREAVRELHDLQRKSTADAISDDMDPAEFAKKYPKLASSLKGNGSSAGAEDTAKTKLPPSVKPAPRASDLTRKKADAGERKSLEALLDEGFSDPDIVKALTGG
jgi:hypothetical protein